MIEDRRIPRLDAADLAIVRGLSHQALLLGDLSRVLELVALKSAFQHPRLSPPRTREAVPVGTLGRMEPAQLQCRCSQLPRGGGGTAVGMGSSGAFGGSTSMPA